MIFPSQFLRHLLLHQSPVQYLQDQESLLQHLLPREEEEEEEFCVLILMVFTLMRQIVRNITNVLMEHLMNIVVLLLYFGMMTSKSVIGPQMFAVHQVY